MDPRQVGAAWYAPPVQQEKQRWTITPQQVDLLNRIYDHETHPGQELRRQTAAALSAMSGQHITQRQVQVWFQNKRQKSQREQREEAAYAREAVERASEATMHAQEAQEHLHAQSAAEEVVAKEPPGLDDAFLLASVVDDVGIRKVGRRTSKRRRRRLYKCRRINHSRRRLLLLSCNGCPRPPLRHRRVPRTASPKFAPPSLESCQAALRPLRDGHTDRSDEYREPTPIGGQAVSPEPGDGEGGEPGKRRRTDFTREQIYELERSFESTPMPSPNDIQAICARTGLAPRVVTVWCQNRRQKLKAEYKRRGEEPPRMERKGNGAHLVDAIVVPNAVDANAPLLTPSQLQSTTHKILQIKNIDMTGREVVHDTSSSGSAVTAGASSSTSSLGTATASTSGVSMRLNGEEQKRAAEAASYMVLRAAEAQRSMHKQAAVNLVRQHTDRDDMMAEAEVRRVEAVKAMYPDNRGDYLYQSALAIHANGSAATVRAAPPHLRIRTLSRGSASAAAAASGPISRSSRPSSRSEGALSVAAAACPIPQPSYPTAPPQPSYAAQPQPSYAIATPYAAAPYPVGAPYAATPYPMAMAQPRPPPYGQPQPQPQPQPYGYATAIPPQPQPYAAMPQMPPQGPAAMEAAAMVAAYPPQPQLQHGMYSTGHAVQVYRDPALPPPPPPPVNPYSEADVMRASNTGQELAPAEELVTEAEGYTLLLEKDAKFSGAQLQTQLNEWKALEQGSAYTGYQGVFYMGPSYAAPFTAYSSYKAEQPGQHLGFFRTAVEGAVAVAKASQPPSQPPTAVPTLAPPSPHAAAALPPPPPPAPAPAPAQPPPIPSLRWIRLRRHVPSPTLHSTAGRWDPDTIRANRIPPCTSGS